MSQLLPLPAVHKYGKHFLTPKRRRKAELIGLGLSGGGLAGLGVFWLMCGSAFGATAQDEVHGAAHDAFMTLPAYTRTSEGGCIRWAVAPNPADWALQSGEALLLLTVRKGPPLLR